MTLPRETIMLAVKRALDAKIITRAELLALCDERPRKQRKARTRRVPQELIDRARAESDRLGLLRDGLRLAVHERKGGWTVMLLERDTGCAPAASLGVPFNGVDDMPRAAEQVVTNYLVSLEGVKS